MVRPAESALIVPGAPAHQAHEPYQRPGAFLRSYLNRLTQFWFSLQLSHHGGEYSVERLIALDEYVQKTSLLRVILVCLGTPFPMIVATVIQEVVPLQNPTDHWSLHYGLWIRLGLLVGVLTSAMAVHSTYMIGGSALSLFQHILLDITVVGTTISVCMVVAAYWAFPIPFVQILLNMVFVVIVVIAFRGTVGSEAFYRLLSHREKLFRYIGFLGLQVGMTVIYPSYQVLFDRTADVWSELSVLFLLPALKIVLKNLLSYSVSHMEDLVPETVIFTVDFFNAVYLATCMQRANSVFTVALIMAIDLSQTVLALHRLHRQTSRILTELRVIIENESHGSNLNLLRAIRALCDNPKKLKRQARGKIRVYSCMPHRLTTSGSGILRRLSEPFGDAVKRESIIITRSNLLEVEFLKAVVTVSRATPSTRKPGHLARPPAKANRPIIAQVFSSRKIVPSEQQGEGSRHLLYDTLEVLFTSECLLLTEYLESIVPVLYGNYILMMVRLPNAKYHTELQGITRENVSQTVQTVFAYAVLEFISFAALVILLQRNCRMQALYQLAFVLETHMPLVQTKLISWVLVTLSYRVVHFGADFTFKFAWIQSQAG